MLKKRVKTLEGIDEKFHSLYTKEGEFFVLIVEDDDDDKVELKRKVNEFRDKNKELFRRLEDMERKYKDVDADAYKKAMDVLAKVQDDEEKKLITEGKFDEVFNRRTHAMREDFSRKEESYKKSLNELTGTIEKTTTELRDLRLDDALNSSIVKAGKPRSGAFPDIKGRGRRVWNLEEGKLVPRGSDGQVLYGAKGEVLTMDEWAANLVEEAPHLFENPQGGGAGGGSKGEGRRGPSIPYGNPALFGQNLEGIAKGTVTVLPS